MISASTLIYSIHFDSTVLWSVTIIVHTARGMRSCVDNVGLVIIKFS